MWLYPSFRSQCLAARLCSSPARACCPAGARCAQVLGCAGTNQIFTEWGEVFEFQQHPSGIAGPFTCARGWKVAIPAGKGLGIPGQSRPVYPVTRPCPRVSKSTKTRKGNTTMPRLTPQEAGRLGGLKGGRSRSAKKLAACKRNGFQKTDAAPQDLQPGCGCVVPAAAPTQYAPQVETRQDAPPLFRPVIVAAKRKEAQ